jgi:pimeloyl-ACP methyl ester carboxylesterase
MRADTALWFVAILFGVEAAAQAPQMPGSLVDVGGRRLHVDCRGSGRPTVVVENGGGAFSIDWALVQPAVAKFTRICTYDRAGYAWSDPSPLRNLPEEAIADFQMLLRSGVLEQPVVLVGQSNGGILIRDYQRRFPEQVLGMVLVDPTHDLAYIIDGKPKPITEVSRDELAGFMRDYLAGTHTPPPVPTKVGSPFDRLPLDVQPVRVWAAAQHALDFDPNRTPYIGEAQRQEFVSLRDQRLSKDHPLGSLPLVVLTNAENPQKATLVSLSSSGRLVVAEHSCHEIHICSPDLVIQAIRDVVGLARKSVQ